jgi:hypothetical protein
VGITNCPEIRPIAQSDEVLAIETDARVREIDRVVRESWSELAALSIRVRDRQLWALLSFHSFDEWLADAAPVCRATIYKGMGILSVLAKDLSPEEIAGIEIGNASILAYEVSSPAVRRDPEVIQAAKSGRHTRKLRDVVMSKYPNQHLENIVEKKLVFSRSAWEKIEAAYEAYRVVDEKARLEDFIEWLVSECQ